MAFLPPRKKHFSVGLLYVFGFRKSKQPGLWCRTSQSLLLVLMSGPPPVCSIFLPSTARVDSIQDGSSNWASVKQWRRQDSRIFDPNCLQTKRRGRCLKRFDVWCRRRNCSGRIYSSFQTTSLHLHLYYRSERVEFFEIIDSWRIYTSENCTMDEVAVDTYCIQQERDQPRKR